jgi:hypothetical protein
MASWLQAPEVQPQQQQPSAAWQQAPLAEQQGEPDYGIDFTAGHEGVRLALESLPPEQREPAMRQWAQTRMANPQGADALIAEAGGNAPGRSIMLGFADEAGAGIDAGLNAISGGRIGAPYDEGLALRRAADEKYDTENPVKSTLGQIAGGFAVPGIGGGSTALRRVGSAVAGGAGFSAANQFGNNEGGDGNLQQQFVNRLEGVPQAAAIGGAAGGVLSGVAEGARGLSNIAARHGTFERDALTKTIQSLPDQSVDKLADQLSSGATRSTVQPKLRRAFDILGEEMVAAKGDKVLGQKNAIDRITAEYGFANTDTAKGYIKEISDSHSHGELFIGEYPSVAASDDATRTIQNLDEPRIDALRSSEETSAMVPYNYAARAAGEGGSRMRASFDDRTRRSRGVVRDWMGEAAPKNAAGKRVTADEAEEMLDGMINASKKAYRDFDAKGEAGYDQSMIFNDLPRILSKHSEIASTRGADHAAALRGGIEKFLIKTAGTETRTPILKNGKPTGQYKVVKTRGDKIAMPTFKILQDQRQALRKIIDDMKGDPLKKGEDAPGTAELKQLYRDVSELMGKAAPGWKAANDKFAEGKIKQRLLDFGANLTKSPGDAQRAAFKIFDKAPPEGQAYMQMRVLRHINDMLEGKGDTHDIAKMYLNENWRKIITKVFPRHRIDAKGEKVLDRTGENFIRMMRNLQVAANNKARATGNSVTGEVLEMNKAMDADLNMIGSVQTMNAQTLREAILQATVAKMRGMRTRKLQPILTTQARDVPNAAMRVEQLRRQKKRITDAKNAKRSDIPQRGGYAANVFADGEDE